jgi:hypothetical protein
MNLNYEICQLLKRGTPNCLGNEIDVETCTFSNWENNHCTHSNDVGIDCGKYLKYIFKIAYYYSPTMSSYRLVNYLTFK